MLPSSRCFVSSPLQNISRRSLSQVIATTNVKPSTSSSSTVDQKEIDQHAKQTAHWWNPNGPMKALHAFNLLRVPFVRDGLVNQGQNKTLKPLKDKKILDVGCGGGVLSEPFARLGAKVTGLDASGELIELAQQHSRNNPKLEGNCPNYICSSIEDHATKCENYYDGVVASEIIEHVSNKELFIKSCIKTLKPGGRIFFTTPCRTRLANFTIIFLSENVLNAIPKGTHQIEKFTTPTELSFLLERNNCQVEMISGMFYNILTNRFSWFRSQSLMFALQAIKYEEKETQKRL